MSLSKLDLDLIVSLQLISVALMSKKLLLLLAARVTVVLFSLTGLGLGLAFGFVGCSSTPPPPVAPAWTQQTSRTVDNGYIVYVGKAEASRADDAQFKSEGLALEDLANECSLVPKGTRIEDRYTEATKTGYVVYTKVALEFQQCDEASKAVDPAQIRKLGNIAFTEQLKKYQDLEETGFRGEDDEEGNEITPPEQIASAPDEGTMNPRVHFYVTRQYIAYQKEIVVLAPPAAYAPGSKEAIEFHQSVAPAVDHVQTMVQKDPQLRSAPESWSRLADRPHYERPASLRAAAKRTIERHRTQVAAPRVPRATPPPNRVQGKGKKRRRYR